MMYPMHAMPQNDLHFIVQRLQTLRAGAQLPKAILFQVECLQRSEWIVPVLQCLLCTSAQPPCGTCIHCQLVQQGQHPDVDGLISEASEHPVKIEAVRALEQRWYLPPQMAARRIVWIEDLAHMTEAASQAVLKILEEPPSAVMFVATTAMTESILPTVLSRFQRWLVPSELHGRHPLATNDWILACAARGSSLPIPDLQASVHQLTDLLEAWMSEQMTAYDFVELLLKQSLRQVLRHVYLIFYQLLALRFLSNAEQVDARMHRLSHCFSVTTMFKIMDELEQQLKCLEERVSIQPAVNLEYLVQLMKIK